MKYTIEFTRKPAALNNSDPEDIATSLGKILNQDLERFWGSQVTVTPDRSTL